MSQNKAEIELVHFEEDYREECYGDLKRYLELLNKRTDEEKEAERKLHDMVSLIHSQLSEITDTIERLKLKQEELKEDIRKKKKEASNARYASVWAKAQRTS